MCRILDTDFGETRFGFQTCIKPHFMQLQQSVKLTLLGHGSVTFYIIPVVSEKIKIENLGKHWLNSVGTRTQKGTDTCTKQARTFRLTFGLKC